MILAYGEMVRSVGALASNIGLCVLFLIGLILQIIIKPDLKRQAAKNVGIQLITQPEVNGNI